MAKAIVLTYAPTTAQEKKLLKKTDIFKIACNTYCADLNPNVRLTADDIVTDCVYCDTCPVVSLNYDLDKDRVINGNYLPKRHSSLLSCIDYLYMQGYNQILLVASNPDSKTSKINYDGIEYMKDYIYLWKYTAEGNFNIPHKTIEDFIMLTDDEKILGLTEPAPRKLYTKTVFTDACLYEVSTKGFNNVSVENGILIGNILPLEEKTKFLNGADEIEYNGMIIKRVTRLEPPKKEEVKPVEETEEQIEEKIVKKPVRKTAARKKARTK